MIGIREGGGELKKKKKKKRRYARALPASMRISDTPVSWRVGIIFTIFYIFYIYIYIYLFKNIYSFSPSFSLSIKSLEVRNTEDGFMDFRDLSGFDHVEDLQLA